MAKNNAIFDYKKQFPDLYAPGKTPVLRKVPPLPYFQVKGEGAPESPAYQEALALLYALSFTIKMSKMGQMVPAGYFEYVVPPLEGLWCSPSGNFTAQTRCNWQWTSMIRQPEFVTQEVFTWAKDLAQKKKPELPFNKVLFTVYDEGLCAQMMHLGPYAEEPHSLAILHDFITENGYLPDASGRRSHHEIYLGDPRKTKPERLKTVLRIPLCPA